MLLKFVILHLALILYTRFGFTNTLLYDAVAIVSIVIYLWVFASNVLIYFGTPSEVRVHPRNIKFSWFWTILFLIALNLLMSGVLHVFGSDTNVKEFSLYLRGFTQFVLIVMSAMQCAVLVDFLVLLIGKRVDRVIYDQSDEATLERIFKFSQTDLNLNKQGKVSWRQKWAVTQGIMKFVIVMLPFTFLMGLFLFFGLYGEISEFDLYNLSSDEIIEIILWLVVPPFLIITSILYTWKYFTYEVKIHSTTRILKLIREDVHTFIEVSADSEETLYWYISEETHEKLKKVELGRFRLYFTDKITEHLDPSKGEKTQELLSLEPLPDETNPIRTADSM